MKRVFLSIYLILSIFWGFAENIITFRVADYPPYYFKENGDWKGLSVELMKVLVEEAGYNITYSEIPWKRALVSMKSGHIDAMANLSITKERSEFIHFVGPQMDESMVLFFKDGLNYNISNLDDIKMIPGKIGIQLGLSYGEEFDRKIGMDLEFADKFSVISDGNMYGKLLKKGRVSGFILNRYVFYYKQSINNDFRDIVEHPFTVNQDNIYFGFSKTNFDEEQITQLQKAYERVKGRGEFEAILAKYRSPSLDTSHP